MSTTLRRIGAQRHVGDLPPDEGQIVGDARYPHNSVRRRRRCTEGRLHRFERGLTHYSPDTCRHCGDERGEVACWSYECGEDADLSFERWVVDIPNAYGLLRGEPITSRVVRDQGTCDWCIERHRREDTYRHMRGQRDIQESHYIAAVRQRAAAREVIERERRETWQRATEQRRQRAMLRQGHRTLTAIRRHLQGVDRLQPPESRPARTSRT